METPLDVEAIRRRVAQRASDLTGVTVDEITRELAPVAGDPAPDPGRNWTLAFHGASKLVQTAVEQAIGEIKAEQEPLAGRI